MCGDNLQVREDGTLCVVPGSLGLREILIFEEDDMFCPGDYPWLARVGVHVYGGGGSGGGTESVPPQEAAEGGGGGGGAYSYSLLEVDDLGTNCIPIIVGQGGDGADPGEPGNDGGSSAFGGLVVAPGGEGGDLGAASSSNRLTPGGAGGNRISGTGQIRISGARGGNGRVVGGTLVKTAHGGAAGGPHGGQMIVGSVSSGSGFTGRLWGGGSPGASQSGTGDARGSQPGARGAIIIELYG